MPRPYSLELRTAIVRAIADGTSPEEIMRDFSVSRRTVYNYLRLVRETGEVKQRTGRPGRREKLDAYRDRIMSVLSTTPNITMKELQEQLSLPVSLCTLSRTLQRWNMVTSRSQNRNRSASSELVSDKDDPIQENISNS